MKKRNKIVEVCLFAVLALLSAYLLRAFFLVPTFYQAEWLERKKWRDFDYVYHQDILSHREWSFSYQLFKVGYYEEWNETFTYRARMMVCGTPFQMSKEVSQNEDEG